MLFGAPKPSAIALTSNILIMNRFRTGMELAFVHPIERASTYWVQHEETYWSYGLPGGLAGRDERLRRSVRASHLRHVSREGLLVHGRRSDLQQLLLFEQRHRQWHCRHAQPDHRCP